MISNQENLNLSPYMAIYDIVVPFQNTEAFKQLAANRNKVEAKNSELKNGHGYDTASTAGLFGMEIQGATTIFAVNLKRILKLLNENE
ncbi:hypothetical protein LSPCS325_19350 [Lysinibacillus sp. CTST325]